MNNTQRVSSIRTAWTAGYIFAAFRTLEVIATFARLQDFSLALEYSTSNIITAIVVLLLCTLYRRGMHMAMYMLPPAMLAILAVNIMLDESLLRIGVDVIMLVIFGRGALAVRQSAKG